MRRFIDEERRKLVAEFSEVRSGLKSAGMQLREALRTCRMRRAILTVASIDRLSRRLALITAVMDSDIELAVVDSPEASRVVLHIKGAWAEHESERLSERIKAALAEAKKQGVKLGGRRPIEDMRAMAVLGHRAWKERALARAMEIAPLIWRLRARGENPCRDRDRIELAECANAARSQVVFRRNPEALAQNRKRVSGARRLRRSQTLWPVRPCEGARRTNYPAGLADRAYRQISVRRGRGD